MQITLNTVSAKYARTRFCKVHFDEGLYLIDKSWLHQALEIISWQKLIHDSTARAIKRSLTTLAGDRGWIGIVKSEPSAVDMKAVIAAYHRLDILLGRSGSKRIAKRDASIFRQFIRNYFSNRGDCPQSRDLFAKHKSRIPAHLQSRKSISDLPDPDPESEYKHPAGATPHRNAADHKQKVFAKRQLTLKRLEKACEKEILSFRLKCEWLENLEACSADELSEHLCGTASTALSAERLVGGMFNFISANPSFLKRHVRDECKFTHVQKALATIAERLVRVRANIWSIYLFPQISNTDFLVMLVVLLQAHSGWNASSVICLKTENIVALGPKTIQVQSSKERTDDETPPFELDPSHKNAWWAIHFLVARHKALLKFGYKPGGSLFASVIRAGEPISAISASLRRFQKDHKLPIFSLDQIRTEKINFNILSRGLQNASLEAGHADISTTQMYAGQALEHGYFSSLNFEFTKRLERDILSSLERGVPDTAFPSLRPTGDGSCCTDPELPPVEKWLEGEICGGENCHSGEGCPNRRLQVSDARMEEVAYTNLMYRTSWRRLLDENAAAFETRHLPRLLFSKTFGSVLLNGPHGQRFRTVCARVESTYRI